MNNLLYKKNRIEFSIGIVIVSAVLLSYYNYAEAEIETNATSINLNKSSLQDYDEIENFVIQKTEMSSSASVAPPGHLPHEVVFALPIRDDGKIWSGIASFTSSKPIEVEIIHMYKPETTIDKEHGEPYHVVVGDKDIAVTQINSSFDNPLETNENFTSGVFNFVGNALVFHKTSSEPFTVTYTIDATVKELSNNYP
ncbi:MAG: hypothetical protein ACPKQO_00080 [Nitrososphaeraceae archaeon]